MGPYGAIMRMYPEFRHIYTRLLSSDGVGVGRSTALPARVAADGAAVARLALPLSWRLGLGARHGPAASTAGQWERWLGAASGDGVVADEPAEHRAAHDLLGRSG